MRRRRAMAEINVVPYIDVMLVLLIIFMVSAPLINPGEIELPAAGAKLDVQVAPLEVRIRRNGDLLLVDRNRGGTETRVDFARLSEAVLEAQRGNAGQAVVIAADKNVRYEEVVKVLDLLKRSDVKRVGLLARAAGQ